MNLTNTKIQNTYGGVLNIGSAGLTGSSLLPVTDGFGNVLPLQVSATTVHFTGNVTGIPGGSGAGVTGATGAGGALGHYLIARSTVSQTNGGPSTANPINYNTTDGSYGISVNSNSRILISADGTYNIQFSAQVFKSDAGNDDVFFWLSKNGTNVSGTTSKLTIVASGAAEIVNGSYMVNAVSGDYYEIYWSSNDLNLQLLAQAAGTLPNKPAISSVILGVQQVMFAQNGATGAAGSSGTSGINGTSGTSGNTGTSGTSGTSGTNGAQGSSGTSGANGTSGTSGINGVAGSNGTSGANGSAGTSGNTGSSGTSGLSGNHGSSGTSGINGTSGTGGSSGTSGSNGTSGTSGSSGTHGSSGTSGAQGATGADGVSTSIFDYIADANTQGGDPAAGHIRWSAVGQTGATAIYVDHLDSNGQDIDVILALVQQSQKIIIQKRTNSADYQTFTVSGTPNIFPNQYVEYPVTYFDSGGVGTTNFSNNDTLLLLVAGFQGTSGTSGINGSSGTSGATGATGIPGSSGTSGAVGQAGSSGTSGAGGGAGSSGTSGTAGAAGSSGTSGTGGSSGTSGAVGASGTAGSAGTSGTSGLNGAAGSSGTSGGGITGGYVQVDDTKVWSSTIAQPTGNVDILIRPTNDSNTFIHLEDGERVKLGPDFDITIGSSNTVAGSYNTVIGRSNTVASAANVAAGFGNNIDSSNRDAIAIGNSNSIPALGSSYGETTIAMGFQLAAKMRGALNTDKIWFKSLPGATAGQAANSGFFGDQSFYTNYNSGIGSAPFGATAGSVYSDPFGNLKIAGLGGTQHLATDYVFVNGPTAATPISGRVAIFATTSGDLKKIDSSGTVTDIGGGSGTAGSSGTSGGGATITSPGANRVLTSDGTTSGVVGNSNLTFDGTVLGVTGQAVSRLYNAGNVSGNVTINWNNSNQQKFTLIGNTTFTFSNPVSGGVYNLEIVQGGTSSYYGVTWPGSGITWVGGTAPSIQTVNGSIDLISFLYDGSTYVGVAAPPRGATGAAGSSGTSGTNGAAGAAGSSGTSGSRGTSGTSGINGTFGTSGSSGTSGINGSSGTSGINGIAGSSGTSGSNGTSGSTGTSGTSGISGAAGSAGTSGNTGTSGTSGTNGPAGAAGSSGTSGAGSTAAFVEVDDQKVWSSTLTRPTGDQDILIRPTSDTNTKIQIHDGESVQVGPNFDIAIGSSNTWSSGYNVIIGRAITSNSASNVILGYGGNLNSSNRDSVLIGNQVSIGALNSSYGECTSVIGFQLGAKMRGALNVEKIWFNALPGATAGVANNSGFFGDDAFYTNYTTAVGSAPFGATAGSVYSDPFGNLKIAGLGGKKNLATDYVFVNGATAATPAAGRVTLFADSSGILKKIDSSATVTTVSPNVTNSSNDRILTATATANEFNAETDLTFNGLNLTVGGTGAVYAAAFYETSDARLKEILDDNYVNPEILEVKAKLYEKSGVKQVGYLAQDVDPILPQAVTVDQKGYLNLSYIEVLVAKVAALEHKISELEKQITQK